MESIVYKILEGGAETALALLLVVFAYKCYKTSYHSKCKTKYCTTILDQETSETANNPLEDQDSL